MNGHVVRARRGERHLYRPLRCRLCDDSDPFAVLEALRAMYPFSSVYVADLDAIQGHGDHGVLIHKLCTCYPSITFWVDQGPLRYPGPWRNVLGSESLSEIMPLCRKARGQAPLLSLDFRGSQFQGPPELWRRKDLWPRDIIVMQLRRVGSGLGPDLPLLHRLRTSMGRRAGTMRLYAAGGVRDLADLGRLRRTGAAGVLLAGVLYDAVLDTPSLISWLGTTRPHS